MCITFPHINTSSNYYISTVKANSQYQYYFYTPLKYIYELRNSNINFFVTPITHVVNNKNLKGQKYTKLQ